MKWFDNGSYAKYEFGMNPIIGNMDLDRTRNIGNIFGYFGSMDLDTEPEILNILVVWIWIEPEILVIL